MVLLSEFSRYASQSWDNGRLIPGQDHAFHDDAIGLHPALAG